MWDHGLVRAGLGVRLSLSEGLRAITQPLPLHEASGASEAWGFRTALLRGAGVPRSSLGCRLGNWLSAPFAGGGAPLPFVSTRRIDQVFKMLTRLYEMKGESRLSFLSYTEHQKRM